MPVGQTCSQRQNLPRLRSHGIETELTWNPFTQWTLGAGYAWSQLAVSAPGGQRRQAARFVPQRIPQPPMWDSTGRDCSPRPLKPATVGPRFEDDLNTIELDAIYLVGLRVNRALGSRAAVHLKVENLLDEKFEITRSRRVIGRKWARDAG